MATRPGSRTPRPRRRTESTMEYTAVVIATPMASERIAKTVKSGVVPSRLRASLMSLTTRRSVASLVAQGHKGIHSEGPARGQECGGAADAAVHCRPGCRAVNVTKAKLKGLFADELALQQPSPGLAPARGTCSADLQLA